MGGGSRHGAQPWPAAAARRTAAAAAAASRSPVAVCGAGAGTSTQPRHPVVDLRTSVGPRPGTPPVLPLSGSPPAGCRAARPSPARHCPAICENVPVWLFLVMSIVCTSCSGLHFAPWITYTVDGNPKEKLFIFSRVCKFFADIFARPAHHVPAGWSRHTEQVWPKLNR